ncbi:hypothetical protein ACG02S_26155 [Roseateles sp. DC23W]|uniref:Uncharacterized protein n=1 Tax=Pelomonas dachongensis TaxID=3299029 RepID=A0ABW7EV71_9BURK
MKIWLGLASGVALILSGYFVWCSFSEVESTPPPSPPAKSRQPSSSDGTRDIQLQSANSVSPQVSDSSAHSIDRSPYTEKNLYPFLVKVQTQKTPGAWGAGRELLRACIVADLARHRFGGSVNASDTALRLQAREEVQRRCGETQALVNYVNQFAPAADDLSAQRFFSAVETLQDIYVHRNAAKIRAALEELASQGRMEAAESFLYQMNSWNGVSWKNEIGNFAIVVSAAVELAGASPGREREDIRLLSRCLSEGRCDYTYGALPDTVSSLDRARMEKTVIEIAGALRSGDVKRILGEP